MVGYFRSKRMTARRASRSGHWPLLTAVLALVLAATAVVWPDSAGAQSGAQTGAQRDIGLSAGGPYLGPVGEPIRMEATIQDPEARVTEYRWDFGDGQASPGRVVEHAYAAAGTYNVVVQATLADGAEVRATTAAQVTAAVSISASAGGPYMGRVGDAIRMMGTINPASVAVQEWTWQFGDGTIDTGQSVVKRYSMPGTYNIRLTVRPVNEAAVEATTTAVIVAEQQIAGSAGGPYSGQPGQPITMTASVSPSGLAVREWLWSFGDGSTGSGQTVQHAYAVPGTYPVSVEIRPANEGAVMAITTATVSGIVPPPPMQGDQVRLFTGCNMVALTWPVGTPIAAAASAISPPTTTTMWKYDPQLGVFRGFSSTVPDYANNYQTVESYLEAVFTCVTSPAMMSRPAP